MAGVEVGLQALVAELAGRCAKCRGVPLSLSSFLVEKQPPQVLKTQTKFQASVRFLLGPRLLKAAPKPYVVRADMVTEKQARELELSNYSNTLR